MSPDRSFPVIRIEIESLKHSILHAFNESRLDISSFLEKEINKFCREGYVEEILEKEVSRALDQAIRVEVQNYFSFGDGREAVKSAVIKRLSSDPRSRDSRDAYYD